MKYILLLILVGCAVTMEELITEAKECVAHSANEFGVIGASNEQSIACWDKVNEKLESQERRAKEREAEASVRCPKGFIKMCGRWGCNCISRWEFEDWRRRNSI